MEKKLTELIEKWTKENKLNLEKLKSFKEDLNEALFDVYDGGLEDGYDNGHSDGYDKGYVEGFTAKKNG